MSTATEATQSSIDESSRSIYLFGAVDEAMVQLAIPAIQHFGMTGESDDPIHVHVMSDGGMIACGLAIHDALRASSVPIITHAHADVLSSALLFFLAGDERIVSTNTSVMFHRPYSSVTHADRGEYSRIIEDLKVMETRIDAIFDSVGVAAFSPVSRITSDRWIHGAPALLEAGVATVSRPVRQRTRATIIPHIPSGS